VAGGLIAEAQLHIWCGLPQYLDAELGVPGGVLCNRLDGGGKHLSQRRRGASVSAYLLLDGGSISSGVFRLFKDSATGCVDRDSGLHGCACTS